jgi:hypothetical protein
MMNLNGSMAGHPNYFIPFIIYNHAFQNSPQQMDANELQNAGSQEQQKEIEWPYLNNIPLGRQFKAEGCRTAPVSQSPLISWITF